MSTSATDRPQRDDRVLLPTRIVAAAIVPVLTAAFVILFLFPGQTHALWGWTIKSRMSAMFMGVRTENPRPHRHISGCEGPERSGVF